MVTTSGTRRADLSANGFSTWTWRDELNPGSRWRIMRYLRRLRTLEELQGRPGVLARLVRPLLWRVHLHNAAALGFSIPLNTCGPGLSLAHYGAIVVNDSVSVGANCRIHPGVVIGRSESGTPVIGERCYIGAGAKVYGGITVGDEVVVAPNAVVNKDVPSNCVVGGVPARVIRTGVAYSWRD